MTITETPPSSLVCNWCEGGVSASDKNCPSCFMSLTISISPATENTVSTSVTHARKKASPRTTKAKSVAVEEANVGSPLDRIKEASATGSIIVVGIDPGARYVGFCVRDNKNNVFISSTFRRPDEIEDSVEWAKKVVTTVADSLAGIEYDIMGIEGVTDPKGFKYGKKDALNPKDIIRTGIVVGALAITYPDAFIVRPRGNGDKAAEEYPDCLSGTRPKTLGGYKDPGVNVRKHERSAYDVAEHALFEHVQSQTH